MEGTRPNANWESTNYKISRSITTRLLSIESQCPSGNNANNQDKIV